MESERGFLKFQEFLAQELAVENLLFWSDVRYLEKFVDAAQRKEKSVAEYEISPYEKVVVEKDLGRFHHLLKISVKNIFEKYVAEEAPYSVNISGPQRASVKEKIENLKTARQSFSFYKTIFEESKVEVYLLMETAPYQRFALRHGASLPWYQRILRRNSSVPHTPLDRSRSYTDTSRNTPSFAVRNLELSVTTSPTPSFPARQLEVSITSLPKMVRLTESEMKEEKTPIEPDIFSLLPSRKGHLPPTSSGIGEVELDQMK